MEAANPICIMLSSFDNMFSSGLCGCKAVDYQCALHSSKAQSSICVAMNAVDLQTALKSYDQVFRRIASYSHESYQSNGRPVQLIMLIDGSGLPVELDSGVATYTNLVEGFLNSVWIELHGSVSN